MRTLGWLALAGLALASFACTSILGDFNSIPDEGAAGATTSSGLGGASASSSAVATTGSRASSTVASSGENSASSGSSGSTSVGSSGGGGQGGGTGGGGAGPISCSAPLPDPCGSTCTDLTADADNCGRCGHSCQGGDCTQSVCQPVTIAQTTYYANALAVDSTSVYWVETEDSSQIDSNGSVKKAPRGGGGGYTLLAGQQNSPSAIAVNASGVFWLNQNTAAPGGLFWLAPGTINPIQLAPSYDVPVQLALTSTNVYWFDTTMTGNNGENLLSLSLSGLGPTSAPTIVMDITACIFAPPVLNKDSIVWVQSGCFANSGTIKSAPLSPLGDATTLLPSGVFLNGPYSAARIAIDANNVYFGANNSSGVAAIESVSLQGGSLSVAFEASPNGVALDGTNFYWTDNQQMAVLSRPLAGGPTTVLADNQSAPYDIVLDSTSVYWTNNSSPGNVMKVAKP